MPIDLQHEFFGQHIESQRIVRADRPVRAGASFDWHVRAQGPSTGFDGSGHGHGDEIVPLHRVMYVHL